MSVSELLKLAAIGAVSILILFVKSLVGLIREISWILRGEKK